VAAAQRKPSVAGLGRKTSAVAFRRPVVNWISRAVMPTTAAENRSTAANAPSRKPVVALASITNAAAPASWITLPRDAKLARVLLPTAMMVGAIVTANPRMDAKRISKTHPFIAANAPMSARHPTRIQLAKQVHAS